MTDHFLLSVLRGENKAALDIARRTGVAVDLSARYEQYGMSEQALWDRIYEMDEWWRESTWYDQFSFGPVLLHANRCVGSYSFDRVRLITRELPDL